MSAVTIQQMAARVAGLMEERLRIRGRGLPEKMQRGGKRLPRRVRRAGEKLSEASVMAQNPRLLMQLDHAAIATAYDICVRYLSGLNRWERLRLYLLNFAASTLLIVLVVGGLFATVLKLRGDL
ncbi:hypothetical protein FAZ78_19565 [Cereibacter changlensis]|jgi:hypothetical protein|nr:hypothetical protein [Cereibacter changlensis]MBZ4690883.1 hypothetical protein [Cereibacter sp.]PZX50419.1 hypothetical protein LX76_03570 [Cereibacter changlensis]TKA94931.1 hypothetical protein FAZ78_19565 [Cereibacter changlensis]